MFGEEIVVFFFFFTVLFTSVVQMKMLLIDPTVECEIFLMYIKRKEKYTFRAGKLRMK